MTTLDELREEHGAVRIGERWLDEVERMCRSVVRSYSPEVYAQAASWDDGLPDLVQRVVIESLLGENQAEYLMDNSLSLDAFRRLLRRQVQRVLAHGRTRTVVDQLLDRARPILRANFDEVPLAGRPAWSLPGHSVTPRSASTAELWRAAGTVRGIPIVPYSGTERAPMIYRTEDLKALLRTFAACLETPFNIRDLDEAFKYLLTPYLPSSLERSAPPDGGTLATLTPAEEYEVATMTQQILSTLTDSQRTVVAAKLSDISDGDLARALGVSRPTAAKRKQEAWGVLEMLSFDEASGRVQLAVSQRLAIELLGRWTSPPSAS